MIARNHDHLDAGVTTFLERVGDFRARWIFKTDKSGKGHLRFHSGDVADAALFGDVILFSPNFWGVDNALEATGPLKGKTVLDVTNPLEWNPNGRMVRSLPGATTAGEELAKKLPDAHVVKAFSTIPASFIPPAVYRVSRNV
jgi:predicted dinucleotide-binding enzyme